MMVFWWISLSPATCDGVYVCIGGSGRDQSFINEREI